MIADDCVMRNSLAVPRDQPRVESWLRAEAGKGGTLDSRPMARVTPNLASERNCFVGREQELLQLGAAIGAGARLVSLIGSAGSGKTSIAREYVRTLDRD